MINETIMINFSKNWTMLSDCTLNQADLLAEVQRIPKSSYYILVFGLAALLFYFFIQPYLSKKINEGLLNYVGLLGVCLVFLSAWTFSLVVFTFEEEQLLAITKVASFLVVPLLLLLGYVAYRRYRK